MRVGLIIYGSLSTVSGGYLYDRLLVDWLRAHGDSVAVVSLPWRSYAHHLGDNFDRSLWHRLRHGDFDVLLQDELNHPSLFWLNPRLRKAVDYPIVSIVHHLRSSEARPAWQNTCYRLIERRYLASVDGYICNSRTTQQVVERMSGAGRPSIVAHPGSNRLKSDIIPRHVAARLQQARSLEALFIGNVIERKGLHVLIDALARPGVDAWRLTVAGRLDFEPEYVRLIRQQIDEAGLGRRVILAGPVTDADLTARLASSHLLVVPSSYEGFGIVYAEAMGFGLPVIASTAGAASELVSHGQNGYLVGPDNATALAQHLRALAANREQLLRMSLAALERYAVLPTWQESLSRMAAFLHGLNTSLHHANPVETAGTPE